MVHSVCIGGDMKKLYWRCNSGHYYSSPRCPFDGWTFQSCTELAAAADRVIQKGKALSIHELTVEGVAESALERAIIIEFGSERAAFDAFSPEGFMIAGEYKSINQLGPEHL
jgi:hypothetical protein